MVKYGAKGTRWRVRAFYGPAGDKPVEQFSFSEAKARRIARNFRHDATCRAVELAELKWVQQVTPLGWWEDGSENT